MERPLLKKGHVYRASNEAEHKKPTKWFRLASTKELVAEIEQGTDLSLEPIKTSHGGNAPGTFAHELLAVSYAGWISPKFQLMVNQAFIDLKTGKLQPRKNLSRFEILSLAMEAETEAMRLKTQVAANEPKLCVYKRLSDADGSLCLTDAAKTLQLRRKDLINLLSAQRWIYKRVGGKNWIGYQDKIQKGLLLHKTELVTKEDGSEMSATQVRVIQALASEQLATYLKLKPLKQ